MREGERINVDVELRADPPQQRLPLPGWMVLEEHVEIREILRFGPIGHSVNLVHGKVEERVDSQADRRDESTWLDRLKRKLDEGDGGVS